MLYKEKDLYVVFYSSTCGYSLKLLDYLRKNKIRFKGYNVNKRSDMFSKLLLDLNKHKVVIGFDPTHKTKPIVFHKGTFIGGADDTIAMLSKHSVMLSKAARMMSKHSE